jgi:acetyl-CoA acetyltransferase
VITGEKLTAITGSGQSAIGRRLGRSGLDLTVDACLEAISDAGLSVKDIDGLSTWPGFTDSPPGFSPVGAPELKEALRLNLNWYAGVSEAPGQFGSIFNAIGAITAGFCTHVLCFRVLTESSAAGRAGVMGANDRIDGWAKHMVPFNAVSAVNWTALFAQKHFDKYGTTREQLAQIAINGRRNAGLNPKAIYRDAIDLDEYMSSRMISSPLCLFDCDIPIDGATAVIVSSIDASRDLRRRPIQIEAVGSAHSSRYSWYQFDDLATQASRDAAKMMWQRTDLRPADVDVAELYDGFSFICLDWIEQLGFCPVGEGGRFIEGGQRIALNGELPLNTNGGHLSAGRTHGFGLLHEACTQLWGEGDKRQVANDPQIAAVSAGGGPLAGCMLLVRR